jgi:membrane fusion protein, multidrug efflux system
MPAFLTAPRRLTLLALIGVAAVGLIFGLPHTNQANAEGGGAAAAAPPPMPVSVQTVREQNIRTWSDFSGRMQAVESVDLRPEVSGRITEVRFKDGQMVKAGDVLFVIDPRSYEAAVAKAEANLASAKTSASYAKTEFDRAANLVKSQTVSQSVYDQRANSNKVAEANIRSAEADLKNARLELDRAYVKAPISGRVSRAEVTLGNLVSTASAPVLTTIVSNDGIYADFEVDEQTYMKSIHAHASTRDQERQIPVRLTVGGDASRVYEGTIHSFDNQIKTSTGTIRARARFENTDGSLMPGMFVSVKVASGADQPLLLISERAIGSDQSKKFVFVVGADNKVAYREVTLGAQVQGQRVVLSGLQAGDRVVVDGTQFLRPDAVVIPKEIAPAPLADGKTAEDKPAAPVTPN